LQKGFGCVGDYHGYIGNALALQTSLDRLSACGAAVLVPAHGEPMDRPTEATALLRERLVALWRNHAATSSLNHYFPSLYADLAQDPDRLPRAESREPPAHVRRVGYTSFAVLAESGAVLLIDCGDVSVVDELQRWLDVGNVDGAPVSSVDLCWVTHYHDDHVDGLPVLQERLGCSVSTEEHMTEILEQPSRFFLPCLSPAVARDVIGRRDGERWRWHEYTLTAYHFPGQTYYHSGLLVEGHGVTLFFAGDSGSPTGIDDHNCANRCHGGAGRGIRRCVQIWRETRPDYVFNEHQERAFRFSDAQLDHLDAMLVRRAALLAAMLPWPHPDMGSDDGWLRAYPYEQEVTRGETCGLDVQVTNHTQSPLAIRAEAVLPPAWATAQCEGAVVEVPAAADGAARLRISVPASADAGLYVLSLRVTVDGRYLGQVRHALVRVR
ncbi:MAG: MBL fold metallo-hydrolase, partial [Chloroflexi bacterium]|nr:MBL fold metallo-hydrolase [Chloroflexota bacterium]